MASRVRVLRKAHFAAITGDQSPLFDSQSYLPQVV
jgi:hypothetical protein